MRKRKMAQVYRGASIPFYVVFCPLPLAHSSPSFFSSITITLAYTTSRRVIVVHTVRARNYPIVVTTMGADTGQLLKLPGFSAGRWYSLLRIDERKNTLGSFSLHPSFSFTTTMKDRTSIFAHDGSCSATISTKDRGYWENSFFFSNFSLSRIFISFFHSRCT